jgi:hypothetical protein
MSDSSNNIKDFDNTILFFQFLIKSVTSYEFCKQQWPKSTFTKGKTGFYNYFDEKLKSGCGPASFLYSFSLDSQDGKRDEFDEEMIKLFDNWKKSTNTEFALNPLDKFPLILFYMLENNIGSYELKEILASCKDFVIEKAIEVWTTSDRLMQLVNLWEKVIEEKEKKLLLKWALKRSFGYKGYYTPETWEVGQKKMEEVYGFLFK